MADLILILLALLFPLFNVITVCEALQTYEHTLFKREEVFCWKSGLLI